MKKSKFFKNKEKSQMTSAQMITQIFVRIFLIFTLLNIVAISSVVAFNGLQMRESEGASLGSAVQEAALNGNINWREFELIGDDGHWGDYVRVTRSSGSVDESQGTGAFLRESTQRFDNFFIVDGSLFWYTSSLSHGNKVEIWLSLGVILQSVRRTILVIIAIMLLMLLIAVAVIRRFSRDLSQPLSDLASAVDQNDQNENKALPEPKNPLEVQQLAQSFNQLLGRLNQKIAQEQQFVSDASHELRTPVAAVRGHVTLLKRRWREHPEIVDDSLNYIDEESLRMKGLIEELLTISRGNHQKVEKESFDLAAFTARTVSELQPALTQKIIFDDDTHEKFIVNADKASVHHILIAFIENAGKYAPADSQISIDLTYQVDSLDLSVADEGLGIPDNEKEKIFDRFYRVDKSRSNEIPGTGLGLAIAKQYVEMTDARCFVSNNRPQGSVFHLVFPAEK